MEIKKDYREVLLMLEGVLLHIFRGIKERCAAEIDLVRSVYPAEEFLLPEPGKEVRLTFAEYVSSLPRNPTCPPWKSSPPSNDS